MKTVKFLSIVAMMTTAVLLYLTIAIPNPMDQQYDAVVQKIMEVENVHTEQEAWRQHPVLKQVKEQIQEIKQLQYVIQQSTQHPIPPGKEESLQLLKQLEKLDKLKEDVALQLKQMMQEEDRTVAIEYQQTF